MTDAPAKLRPLTDHEIRDAFVRDYKRTVERAGVVPDMRDIERIVLADLALAEAAEREARPAPAPKPSPEKREERKRSLDEQLNELGMRQVVVGNRRPTSILAQPPSEVSARWGFAMGRIARILQPRGNMREAARRGLEGLLQEASYPELASRFLFQFFAYAARHFPRIRWRDQGKPNPYFGLCQGDAARAFMRAVEDICDASTGVLGSWYTR